MAYTETQLTALENAIAQGVTSVRLNGRVIEYRSLSEMQRIRDAMRADLGIPASSGAQSKIITLATGKGL